MLLSQISFVSENVCLLFTSLSCMDNNSLAKQARGIAKNMPNFSRAAVRWMLVEQNSWTYIRQLGQPLSLSSFPFMSYKALAVQR